MTKLPWRCEHPVTGDVKMAAKEDHKIKLEADGYMCEVCEDLAPVDPDRESHGTGVDLQ